MEFDIQNNSFHLFIVFIVYIQLHYLEDTNINMELTFTLLHKCIHIDLFQILKCLEKKWILFVYFLVTRHSLEIKT